MERANTLPHNVGFDEEHSQPVETCPECADDLLEMITGCRFGDPEECFKDTHRDCWE